MKYTVQLIRYEIGVAAPPTVLSSVETDELQAAEVRRTLRKHMGVYIDTAIDRAPAGHSANAARALDESGAEIDRWTLSDEQGMRVVEDR